jgi:hypothetical protein
MKILLKNYSFQKIEKYILSSTVEYFRRKYEIKEDGNIR